MAKSVYVSIFGLRLSTINDLKNIIYNKFSSQFDICWTPISDDRLQILLINDDFSDINYVEKINKSNVRILKLKKNEKLSGELFNNTLYLPINSSQILNEWISNALDDIHETYYNNKKSCNIFPENADISNTIKHQILTSAFLQVTQEYSGISHFVIENNDKIIACFDLKNREFYQHPELTSITGQDLSIVPANLNIIVKFKKNFQYKELNTGIWQFIWDHSPSDLPEYYGAYRLHHWPQPELDQQRHVVLKISAYFSRGCTVQYIEQKTSINATLINRYLFACHIAQIVEEIPEKDSLGQITTPLEIQEVSKVRGFFNSLRKKLGL